MRGAGLTVLGLFFLVASFATAAGGEAAAAITLRTLGTLTYTTLRHSAFPNYAVRIKRTNICESET